jgi:hypothetical protein
MPNYSLVANSTFQPFSFQELAMPIDRENAYHENILNEYDKLSSQSDILEALGSDVRDKDKDAYKKYKDFSQTLLNARDKLNSNGLDFDVRNTLSNLRTAYSKEIVPIQTAYNKREQEYMEQRRALMSNPSLIFLRDAATSSVDDYIKNPTVNNGVINGANITATVANMAKGLQNKIMNEGDAHLRSLDSTTYDYIVNHGITPEMIQNWEKYPMLRNIVDTALKTNGVTDDALSTISNQRAKAIWNKSVTSAVAGLWNGVGPDTSQIVTNYEGQLQAQYEYQKKAAEELGSLQQETNNGISKDPEPLRAIEDISGTEDKLKDLNNWVQKGYIKYTPKGIVLTQSGAKAIRTKSSSEIKKGPSTSSYITSMGGESTKKNTGYSDFKAWYVKNVGGYDAEKNIINTPSTHLNSYKNKLKAGEYDTYRSTEYVRKLKGDDGKRFLDDVKMAYRGSKQGVQEVQFTRNGWKPVGDYIDLSALNTSGEKAAYISDVRYNKDGDTAMLNIPGKNPIRIKLPTGLHSTAQENVHRSLMNEHLYSLALQKGLRPKMVNNRILIDKKGRIVYTPVKLTTADKARLEQLRNQAIDDAYMYGSQYVVTSTSPNEENKSFNF